jgi:hypothetical protein
VEAGGAETGQKAQRQRPSSFGKRPFPAEHDEAAASAALSSGRPGCGCWVCVEVGPRQRAENARAEVSRMAARAAAAEDARIDAECVSLAAGLAWSLDTSVEECGECDDDGFVDASEPETESDC